MQAIDQIEMPRESSGAHEVRLATGSVAQQITLLISTLTMLGVITALARTLSLEEFGVYGLLVSIPTYLLFAQGSIETAAVHNIAVAHDRYDRDRALTTALGAYVCFGLLAALLIVFGGNRLIDLLQVSPHLHPDARRGLLALGIATLIGWPIKAAQDALRGGGHFIASSIAEASAYILFGVLVAVALSGSAPLWTLVGLGGSIPCLVGLCSCAALLVVRPAVRLRPFTLSLAYTRSFLSISFYLLLSGISDLVIYSLDRTILGAYRPLTTVGLYEGPVRAHNLVRQLQSALVVTVMPAASAYVASGDSERLHELLLRGTRYIAIVMMPLTVTFMVLASPILNVWLGPRYGNGATAMTILVSYWLLAGGLSVGLTMMIAVGRARLIALYAATVAILNVVVSLALTPSLGLNGVVIGTSVPYFILLPVFICLICRTFAISVSEFLRQGFLVAFVAGAALAGFEGIASAVLPMGQTVALMSTVLIGLVAYASAVYRVGLRESERLLVRTLIKDACSPLRRHF